MVQYHIICVYMYQGGPRRLPAKKWVMVRGGQKDFQLTSFALLWCEQFLQ